MRTVLVSVLLLSALVPLVPQAAAAVHTVAATNFAWTPEALTIEPGDSVTFTNEQGTHTWELEDQSDSCALPCTRAFQDPGTIEYRCGVHPSMTGTILVGNAPTIAITSHAAGATLTGVVRIEGVAAHVSDDIEEVTLRLGAAPNVTATLSGAGPSVAWSADLPSYTVANGASAITATATTVSGLSATTTIAVVVENAPTTDVVLASVSAQAAALTSNSISFVVRNDGNVPTGDFEILAEYLYHDEWRVIGTATQPSLHVGANGAGSIVWEVQPPAIHVGQFPVRVTADHEGVLPDPARANNVAGTTAGWFTSAAPGIVLTEP